VDRILQRIRIVPDRVGVPGFQTISLRSQERSGDRYAEAVRNAGLTPRVRSRNMPSVPPGFVVDVEPQPGTMVRPGTEVMLTVVAGRDGRAEHG
jgi:PASTA domain